MITAEVTKQQNESGAQTLRRFNKKVQSLGTIKKVRKDRYRTRKQSDFKKRKDALKRIEKRATIAQLRKLGKIKDAPSR